MAKASKKTANVARAPRPRHAHNRQRQRLIDACISALHIYGPSRTTVEKVVAIAKMSPGIVRFYFASKAAMLVASLQFLSSEFEEQLLQPVSRLKSRPVAALELMVDLYLDPEIASPRKVSVWYAFWGEASSRQEYYDICGQKDEGFAMLVRELIEALILETSQSHLDPDGIALGLIGVLEMLWQDFAFRSEPDIDRPGAKRRAMAYLRSVFPGCFIAGPRAGTTVTEARLASWVYADARVFAGERETVFQGAWQLAAHQWQLPAAGDFVAVDLGVERALVVRGADLQVRAFRNSCSAAPHCLVSARAGHVAVIQCQLHGLEYELDGRRRGDRGAPELGRLDLRQAGDLILVRSAARSAAATDPWIDFAAPSATHPAATVDTTLAADWKIVVEQWLETLIPGEPVNSTGWSADRYRGLLGSGTDFRWQRRFIEPNHLIELRPDGFTILQALPMGPGRCTVRSHEFTVCEADRPARAARYLASRLSPKLRFATVAVAESTQKGLVTFGHGADEGVLAAPAASAFRRQLKLLLPLLGLARPPN